MDNQKLALSVRRDASTAKSRSLRDFIAFSRMKISIPFTAQTQIDDELFNEYLGWLLQFTGQDAYSIVLTNPQVFAINMGITQYNKLLDRLDSRR